GPDVGDRRVGVLDNVVRERGGDRLLVEVELGADPRGAERMEHEVLAGPAMLPRVGLRGEAEGAQEQVAIDRRVVGGHLRDQLLDEVLMRLVGLENGHESSVLRAFGGYSSPNARSHEAPTPRRRPSGRAGSARASVGTARSGG